MLTSLEVVIEIHLCCDESENFDSLSSLQLFRPLSRVLSLHSGFFWKVADLSFYHLFFGVSNKHLSHCQHPAR